jgi:choline dehydrogenase-like flavoprotein
MKEPTTQADVVILGSGFAALEIANCVSDRGGTACIVEAGPFTPDVGSASRSHVPFRREPIRSGGRAFGAVLPPGFETVPRVLGRGGTSMIWSGKWRPLDRVDLTRERAGREWPLPWETLQHWYDVVRTSCGWKTPTGAQRAAITARVAGQDLRLIGAWEELPPRRLHTAWDALEQRGRVTLSCSTDVLAPIYDSSADRIEAVRVHAADGEHVIAGRQFVVACGGIASVPASHLLRWSGRRHVPASARTATCST